MEEDAPLPPQRRTLHELPPIVQEIESLPLTAEPTPPKECPEQSASCSLDNSSTIRSRRWRNEASPPKDVLNMWRPAGHLGDGAYDEEDEGSWVNSLKVQSAASRQKRLAGDFIVSPRSTRMTELPPTTPCRARKTQSPYDDVWRVGVAPTGRWVLERGRPRWVRDIPSLSLTQSSMDAWFCGYKEALPESKSLSSAHQEGSSDAGRNGPRKTDPGLEGETVPADMEEPTDSPLMSSEESGDNSVCSEKSSDDEQVKPKRRGTAFAAPCQEYPEGKRLTRLSFAAHKRQSKRQSDKQRQSAQAPDDDGIENIEEILQNLDSSTREPPRSSIPRFPWVDPLGSARMSAPSSLASIKRASVASVHTTVPGDCDMPIPAQARSSVDRERILLKLGLGKPHVKKNRQYVSRQSTGRSLHSGSTASRTTVSSSSSGFSRHSKHSTASHHSAHPRASDVTSRSSTASHSHRGSLATRNHSTSRDQRAQLKRMNQSLSSSAQKAFDAEVWEACGIEAEHLKLHQFASLIQSGLFRIGGNKHELEDEEGAIVDEAEDGIKDRVEGAAEPVVATPDESPSVSKSPKSPGRKVVLNMGGRANTSADDKAAAGSSPSSSGASPRKSALKGAS